MNKGRGLRAAALFGAGARGYSRPMEMRLLPPALAASAVAFLAAFPACAQAQAAKPAIVGNAEKGGVIRNLPAGASEADIETRAADYCLHYALDYKITDTDPKTGAVSFDCVLPND
jgi:hypothetical protein